MLHYDQMNLEQGCVCRLCYALTLSYKRGDHSLSVMQASLRSQVGMLCPRASHLVP